MKLRASGLRLICTGFRGVWVGKTAYAVVTIWACVLPLTCYLEKGRIVNTMQSVKLWACGLASNANWKRLLLLTQSEAVGLWASFEMYWV